MTCAWPRPCARRGVALVASRVRVRGIRRGVAHCVAHGVAHVVAHVVAPVVALAITTGCVAPRTGAPRFTNPPTLSAPTGYTHVVAVPPGHRLVFVAGQVALDSTGALVGAGDVAAQARQVFEHLRRALAAERATFADVVKTTTYVTDAAHVATLRRVRTDYLDARHPPANTLVEVRRLARDEWLLEIEAIAAVPVAR